MPLQQHSPSWHCWGEQKELLHLLVSAAQDLLCFHQRAEFHPTCSFVQVLAKWLLGDSLPLLLTLSFWQGAGQRGGMPGEASALHFPLPPFPLQKSVWSLIQVHPGWDNSSTVRH